MTLIKTTPKELVKYKSRSFESLDGLGSDRKYRYYFIVTNKIKKVNWTDDEKRQMVRELFTKMYGYDCKWKKIDRKTDEANWNKADRKAGGVW